MGRSELIKMLIRSPESPLVIAMRLTSSGERRNIQVQGGCMHPEKNAYTVDSTQGLKKVV